VLAVLGSVANAADVQPKSNWTPIEFTFELSASHPNYLETDTGNGSTTYNPWLDYRLDVVFTHAATNRVITVPGFFAGNGTTGTVQGGRKWRARFAPFGATGTWTWTATIWRGFGANVLLAGAMTPTPPIGTTVVHSAAGSFVSVPAAPSSPGFYGKGPLRAVGAQYYQFENGEYFLKTGSGGPENFLAYQGFAGWARHGQTNPTNSARLEVCTVTNGPSSWNIGSGLVALLLANGHRYVAHVGDWVSGEPTWPAFDQGKGIIGALNYLSSQGINSLFMLLMNLGGDSRDVAPFADIGTLACSPNASVLNYSVERMGQWNMVFSHAARKGIALDLVLAELELSNIHWLGGASLTGGVAMSDERMLFLKNMVAMFAHVPAIKWILCEENVDETVSPGGGGWNVFTRAELRSMAEWIQSWDVYDHPVTVHTTGFPWIPYERILAVGQQQSAWLGGTSLQISGERPENQWFAPAYASTNYGWMTAWVRKVFEHYEGLGYGRGKTVIDVDEIGHVFWGAADDDGTTYTAPGALSAISDFNAAHDRRKRILYDVLFAGANLAWYYGGYPEVNGTEDLGGDHSIEKFSTRMLLYRYTKKARELVQSRPQWWTYESWDALLNSGCTQPANLADIRVNTFDPIALYNIDSWTQAPYNFSPTEFLDGDACDGVYGRPRVFAAEDGGALIHYPSLLQNSAGLLTMSGTWSVPGSNFLYQGLWFDPRLGIIISSADEAQIFDGSAYSIVPPDSNNFPHTDDYVFVVDRIQ